MAALHERVDRWGIIEIREFCGQRQKNGHF